MVHTHNILLSSKDFNQNTGSMVYRFPTAQAIKKSEIALTNFAFYNSFKNISAEQANSFLSFKFPIATVGSSPTTWTHQSFNLLLDDGYYSISDINKALQLFCVNQGLYLFDPATQRNIYFLEVAVNSVRYVTQLNVYRLPTAQQAADFGWLVPNGGANTLILGTGSNHQPIPQFDIAEGIGAVLGVNAGLYPTNIANATSAVWISSPVVSIGARAPAINRVSSIIVRSNFVNSKSSNPVDMLAQVPVTSQYGALTNYVAAFPLFSTASEGTFNTIELYFSDQLLRPITFFDTEIAITLQIREK